MAAFEELGVMPELIRALQDLRWELPTPIQTEAIPLVLGGGDVMAAAETGSGKTGAFGLPVIQIAHELLVEQARGGAAASSSSSSAADTGGTQGPETVRMDVNDREAMVAVSEDGLTVQTRHATQWGGIRANIGITAGHYYYEATVTDEGLARVGWSSKAAKLELGTCQHGFGYGGTAKKSHKKQFENYGETYGLGDTIGCYLDATAGAIWFSKNGKEFPKAFDVPPNIRGFGVYPAVTLKNAEMSFNFGATPFRYPPQAPFVGVSEALKNVRHYSSAESRPSARPGAAGAAAAARKPLILVLEPSQELADQTHQMLSTFVKYLPAPIPRSVLIVGGQSAAQQVEELKKGADIVTATPGRLLDLVETSRIDLSNVRFFVLDEADSLLDQGSKDMVMAIFRSLNTANKLQTLMFSATLHSPEIGTLAEEICRFPTWVDLKGKDSVPECVHHALVQCDPTKDESWQTCTGPTDGIHKAGAAAGSAEYLSEAIKKLKLVMLKRVIEAYKMDQALIFVRTRLDADNVERFLMQSQASVMLSEYACACLHSDKKQLRKQNLAAFKDGSIRFLICTDVAARGIDIHELPYVINFTLPDTPEMYIHRVGRVGRADRMGLAISLVGSHKEKVWYHTCPSKGRGCFNTKLVDAGGCAIWYDEPLYLTNIEKRLGQSIPALGADLQWTGEQVIYGQKRDEQTVEHLHTQLLKPAVAELAVLENDMQLNYLTLLHQSRNT